ncbi:MAG: TetR/AcrR family transcriptional regulator [Ignavibacteriales bacterium]|nr:TetR/AcrR family transcriptional regulator [Ignavibacteriales bacterium]
MVKLVEIMGIQERKDRERAEMRKNILDAAISLFIESGYDSVSIRNISDKIEYSPATIYSYFEDKADILFELHNIGFSELYEKQLRVQGIEDPKERIIAHGRAYLDFALQNPQYYELMFIMRLPKDKLCENEGWDPGQRSYDLLVQNVIECQQAGYFKGQDEHDVAFLTWSTVHGMVSLFIRERIQFVVTNDRFVENFVNNSAKLLRGIIQ